KEQGDPEGIATVTASAERRRAEEIRRSQVKAVVHPLQLVEAAVLMQRAEWLLESGKGRRATFAARRSLSGVSGWSLACPQCGRRLCAASVRYCEGGTNEPVGVDEVAPCASCGKAVCAAHQAVCAVDGQVHCSPHLRRADRSRRLVCARHRGACAEEPAALFASDELAACPICGRGTCELHRTACGYCGRSVCSAELDAESHRCLTCAQLTAVSDPPEAVVLAALA